MKMILLVALVLLIGGWSSTEALHLRVGVIPARKWTTEFAGNVFQGFIPELIGLLSGRMNFTFELIPNNRYGYIDQSTGKWVGLIGDVVDGKIDVAAADLTVTKMRHEVVDFTQPFTFTGISFLTGRFYKDRTVYHSTLLLLHPLQASVWFLFFISVLVTALMICLISHFHPLESNSKDNDSGVCAAASFLGSLWTAFELMTYLNPSRVVKTCGLRVILIIWRCIALLFLALYISALTCLLQTTLESYGPGFRAPITVDTFRQLESQNELKIGGIDGGSTYQFFRTAKEPLYRGIFNKMDKFNTYKEAVEKARTGEYAIVMEQHIAEDYANRDCSLRVARDLADWRSFAFALTAGNYSLREQFDIEIAKLAEEGMTRFLEMRYFERNVECPPARAGPAFSLLGFADVSLLLILLIIGIFIAVGASIFEVFCTRCNTSEETPARSGQYVDDSNNLLPQFSDGRTT